MGTGTGTMRRAEQRTGERLPEEAAAHSRRTAAPLPWPARNVSMAHRCSGFRGLSHYVHRHFQSANRCFRCARPAPLPTPAPMPMLMPTQRRRQPAADTARHGREYSVQPLSSNIECCPAKVACGWRARRPQREKLPEMQHNFASCGPVLP